MFFPLGWWERKFAAHPQVKYNLHCLFIRNKGAVSPATEGNTKRFGVFARVSLADPAIPT